MAKGWVNPKFVSPRERMDRYLESQGLLNYQTEGMSQEEIAAKYAEAGVRVNQDSNWWKDNYKDYPTGNMNLWANTSTIPQGWGTTNAPQPGPNQQGAGLNSNALNKPNPTVIPKTQTGPRVPAIGELVDLNGQQVKVTAAIQNQFISQGLQATQSLTGEPINPNAQTDWKAQDFDWTQLTEAQKAQVLKAPDFRMSDVQAMGQQGLILSDSQFNLFKNQANTTTQPWWAYTPAGKVAWLAQQETKDPNGFSVLNNLTNINTTPGYGVNGDLQWWQASAYSALSNPKTAPIAQAVAMSVITGGKATGTALFILGLSYAAQWKDNENPLLSDIGNLAEKGLYVMNWGAQTAEQVGGTLDYLSGGNIRDNKGLLDNVPIVKLYQAGKGMIEADRIGNFISDPALRNAVWQAGQVFYETQGARETALNQILQTTIADPQQRADTARAINAVLPLIRDENQVWVLGEAEPVPVQPGYTLDDAVNKILKDGYSAEQVLAEYQQVYGLSGVASDFMLQSVFDPMNVADSGVSEVKAKIVDARSQRIMDTGVMTPEQMARVEVNKIKADVYRETPSVNPLNLLGEAVPAIKDALPGSFLPWSETTRKLRASLQTAARGNADIAKVLTPWERKIAGLTPDGKIKELLPSDGVIPKIIDYVVGLRPESKARLFLDRGASVLQSLFDYSKSADMTPKQMVDLLKATANADMTTLKNAGAEFLSAPEAYTIIGAARDFIPQIEKRAAIFENTGEQRARVTQALTALGDQSILKNGLTQADWQRLIKNPGDLADGIKNGTVTFDTLKKDVDVFKYRKDGTTKADLSFEEFQARTAAAFDDHVSNWGKDYFGIRKAGQFEESVRALKGLQSLMLLDISPTSIMNDIINERVMLATRGTLGLTDSATITRFMDDMGVVNRDAQSAGGMGDAVRNPDPISQLTRSEGGLFTRAADAIQKVRSWLPRSQITGRTNEAHQLQVRYAEMKKYMSRNWVEGKGFDRMPPSLEAKLNEYGYDPQVVYQNLRSTFKPDQIELLKTRATNMDVNTFIDQAAAALGKDAGEARATLEQLGALDQLKDGLAKAQNLEQRAAVFDRVSETVVNSIDIRLAQQLKGMLENVRNKIKAEGPAGVVQVFQEIPLDYFERKIENDNIWDDAFARAAEVDDYTVKNAIKSKAAKENQAAWRRTQARQAALYIAALEGLDLSKDFGRDFMLNLADEQKILQKFFDDKNAKAQTLSNKTFRNAEAAASAWDSFFTQFNERFANDQRRVLNIQKKRNDLFVAEMGRMFGQKAEATARNWMDAVMNNSDTMHQMIVEFRQSLQGLPAEERARRWREFKPEYQKAWRERMRVDMQGAGELYKWDENQPYIADYIDRANADMEAKLQADAERRAAIWQIADEFGYKQDTRDTFRLQGSLKKPQYGGIPDLQGLSDPRLTPEVMREILTKRAEVKAAEAALQPELPTQPIVTADAVTGNAPRIGEDTNILKAIEQLGGISKEQARDIVGESKVRGKVFTDTGRGIDEIARLLVDEGYPIDLNRPDDIGGVRQATELIQRAQNGEDIYPVGHSFDRAIDREAKAYYEEQRQQEISRYVSEADTLRQAIDTFDYAAPDAAQKAIDLQAQHAAWYDAPESLWDVPHNDGTLLDTFSALGEELNKLVDDTSGFDRLLDATFEARENMRAMETAGDGLTKREEIHQQLKDVFGNEQGEAIANIVDIRADQWAKLAGKTREEWYATYVKQIRKGGDTPTQLNQYGYSPVWYSKLERTVESINQPSMTAEQLRGALTKAGVKADELKWTGFDVWMNEQGGKVSKAQALEFIRENQVQVQEVTKGGVAADIKRKADTLRAEAGRRLVEAGFDEQDAYKTARDIQDGNDGYLNETQAGPRVGAILGDLWNDLSDAGREARGEVQQIVDTKFSGYTLPGGENYREVLFTLPVPEPKIPELPKFTYSSSGDGGYIAYNGDVEIARGWTVQEIISNARKEYIRRNTKKPDGVYQSGHWNKPNVLAHTRLNDRIDADGKRVLFVEEVQSDWHQAGREKGYKANYDQAQAEADRKLFYSGNAKLSPEEWKALSDRVASYDQADKGVPQAPFSKTWHELVMKRVLRMAAEGGYDRVAWTTGAQQAARYDLAKQVEHIAWEKNDDGTYNINAPKRDGSGAHYQEDMTVSELQETLGKDITEKILAGEGRPDTNGGYRDWTILEGDNLSVGNQGMKGFYDKMLPAFVDKYGKQWGVKTGETVFMTHPGVDMQGLYAVDVKETRNGWEAILNDGTTSGPFETREDAQNLTGFEPQYANVHSIDVTPAMRESVMGGQPLFQMNPDGVMAKGGVDFDADGRATITAMQSADVSTGVHEFAHIFLEDFRRLANDALPEHAQTIKQDMNTWKVWSSVKQDGNVWRAVNAREFTITEEGGKFLYHDPSMPKPMAFESFEQAQYRLEHELFARGFERYMYEGKAPTRALAHVFERFATWMRDIYRNLTGKAINVDISPAMRDLFNRLLTDYDRVTFDASQFNVFSDGSIRPKDTPFGLERINKEQSARMADEIANPDLLAKAKAEQTKATPSEPPAATLLQAQEPAYVWQYTRNAYAEIANADGGFRAEDVDSTHRVAVEQAYRAGRDVPEEVLAEYPYLLTPERDRFNAPDAQARRDAMRQQEAERYYQDKVSRPFYQQSADTNPMPTLPPGGYDQLSGYMDVSKLLYDGWLDEVKPMLDEMKKASQQPENRYNFEGMDEDTRKQLNLYLADTRGKLATSKNAARRWGDEMVDFTLLDYRRQYGFDKLFSAVVPYEFYGVRSVANWFTRVLDRPAYLSHFARIQHLQETYDSQLPERMRGKYFLPMPFLPEWAGDGVFVDPKFALFPWTQFMQPLEAMKRQNANLSNSATYILRDWVEDGTLTEQQAAEALQARSGAYWDKAIEQAKIEQGENLNTGADYFSMLFGPALYLTVPYYLATGEKFGGINSSYPSSQLPITRFGQAVETAFKGTPMEWIGDAAGMLAKPEQMAREAMGLPEFGEWGDYYIDRQLANMAAERRATPEQVQMAMIERKGYLYDQATQRVREEMMLRIPGMAPLYGLAHGASFDKVIGSLIPSLFPGGILPPAEMEYKGLKQEYGIAWDQWEQGNKEAISKFFDAHPEYQARLALRRDPQERIEQFLKSQIWDVYGQLETTDRKSATAQMEGFAEFLDAEPGQSFSVEQLAQWAQQLGAMVPKVEQTAPVFENPAPRINYFAPEVTTITDRYFQERKTLYPEYWKEQNEYYALATRAEKQAYLMQHPNLKAYWDWKDRWYDKHPDLIPVFNGEVFKNVDTRDYPPMLVQMLQMYALTGEEIPSETKPLLEMAWIEAGKPYEDLDTWIEKDLVPSIRNDMMQGMVQ